MTDIDADVERVARLYRQPGAQDVGEASTFLIGFLYHVVPHLKAAGKLLLDEIRDPFENTAPGAGRPGGPTP
jgi:hypothetical protein